MILTPEEQKDAREEIDYLVETHGYEYVWGRETAMDKTKGLLRDAPGKIMSGLQKIGSNPTIIELNERVKKFSEDIDRNEAQQRNARTQAPRPRQNRAANDVRESKTFYFGDDHL